VGPDFTSEGRALWRCCHRREGEQGKVALASVQPHQTGRSTIAAHFHSAEVGRADEVGFRCDWTEHTFNLAISKRNKSVGWAKSTLHIEQTIFEGVGE